MKVSGVGSVTARVPPEWELSFTEFQIYQPSRKHLDLCLLNQPLWAIARADRQGLGEPLPWPSSLSGSY